MKHAYALPLFTLALFTATGAAAQHTPTIRNVAQQSQFEAKLHPTPMEPATAAMRGGVPNDDCGGAILMTVGTTCVPVTGSIDGATESMPAAACSGFTAAAAIDVWYTFVATGTVTVVSATGGGDATTGFDPIVELFAGSCADLGTLGCMDASVRAETESPAFVTVPGATYYYRVYRWTWADTDPSLDFTTCVYTPINIPANDDCANAAPQALAAGGTVTFTGDNTNATDVELLGAPTLWHSFTTTECTNLALTYCGTTPAFANALLNLWSDCPAVTAFTSTSFSTDSCLEGNVTILYSLVPAGTYYYGVISDDGAMGPYTVTVGAVACPAPPANDDCANATMLTAGPWCTYTMFGADLATESIPGVLCNGLTGDASDDLWISFVATATTMTVGGQGADDGDGDPFTGYDAVMEAFDACGGTSLGCADATLSNEAETLELTGLTVGNTYYVRVYNYYLAAATPNAVGMCVVEGGGINIGIEENTGSDAWSIYPNPNNGQFSLNYTGVNGMGSIEVFDLTGRVVYSEGTMLTNSSVRSIDLRDLSAGNYSVRLTVNGERSAQRLMVK